MESAYEWGLRHGSCANGLEARRALGPATTQADWWQICPRGGWLLWQLQRLPADQLRPLMSALLRAAKRITHRTSVAAALEAETVEAVYQVATRARQAMPGKLEQDIESRQQADDIRAEIPVWPEEV